MRRAYAAAVLALCVGIAAPSTSNARAAPDDPRPAGDKPAGDKPGDKPGEEPAGKPGGDKPGDKKPGDIPKSGQPGEKPEGTEPTTTRPAGPTGPAEVPGARPAPKAAAPVAAVQARTAQKERGFWLESRFKGFLTYRLTALPNATYVFTTSAAPGFVIGYKYRRLIVGLAVDFVVWESDPKPAPTSPPQPNTDLAGFSLGPVMQVQFVNRGPVAAYCQLGLAYVYAEADYGGIELHTNGLAVIAALGLRYYVAPSFALGTEIGASPRFTWDKASIPGSPAFKQRTLEMSFYGSLNAAVVW